MLWPLALATALAQEPPTHGGVEVSTGLRGSMSAAQVELLAPEWVPHMRLSLGALGMSATTWATFMDLDSGHVVSVHPVVLGGTLAVGGHGELVDGHLRTYGALELLVGKTLTPYDDAFYGTDNLVGPNLTLGLWGLFGLELFPGPRQALFVESGGGFKTLRGAEDSDYAVATAWLGSGGTVALGTRLFF